MFSGCSYPAFGVCVGGIGPEVLVSGGFLLLQGSRSGLSFSLLTLKVLGAIQSPAWTWQGWRICDLKIIVVPVLIINFLFHLFPQGGCGQKQVLSQILRALWGLEALGIQQWQLLMLGRWNLLFWKDHSVSKGSMSFSGMKSLSDLNLSVWGYDSFDHKQTLLHQTRLATVKRIKMRIQWSKGMVSMAIAIKQSLPFCGVQN